jgi:hypothetical protein
VADDDTETPAINREMSAGEIGAAEPGAEAPEGGAEVGEFWHPVGAPPKEPGWYPMRTNPNDQSYWDGSRWSGRRRWTAGHGWVETGDIPPEAMNAVGTAEAPRQSANPYVQPMPAESRVSRRALRRAPNVSSPLSLGLLLFMTSGILLMVGSITTWIHSSATVAGASLSTTTSGLEVSGLISINGYVTFICGVVITVLAGALMASDDSALRLLAFVAGLASAAFAIYVVVRIADKVGNNTSVHVTMTVGPGIFVVGIGGVLAALVAGARLGQRNH